MAIIVALIFHCNREDIQTRLGCVVDVAKAAGNGGRGTDRPLGNDWLWRPGENAIKRRRTRQFDVLRTQANANSIRVYKEKGRTVRRTFGVREGFLGEFCAIRLLLTRDVRLT